MSELPEEWSKKNLVSCLETIIDYRGKTPKKADNGIVTLSAKSVKMGKIDYSQAYFISKETYKSFMVRGFPKKGDILMTTEAPLGCIAKLDRDDISVAQRLLTLRGKVGILDNNYLMYYLTSRIGQHELHARASGSTVQGIKRSEFNFVDIVLPSSFEEQEAIAKLLSSFDKKIELLQTQNQTLETLAQTIFKEWFVNSDNPTTPISNFIEFNPIEKIDRNKEYLFFDMKALPTDSMVMSDGVYKTSNSGTSFREKDTLLAKITPCLENGKTAFVLDLKGEEIARGSTEFIVMRAKYSGSPYLNYCLARYPLFRDYTVQSMIGTSGRQRVPIDRVKTFEINFSSSIIDDFNNVLDPIFNKIKNNAKQTQTLTKTRDTLLPKLISGEIRTEGFEL